MRHAGVKRKMPASRDGTAVFDVDAEERIDVRAEEGVLGVVFRVPFLCGVADSDTETRVEHVTLAFQEVETHVRIRAEDASDFGHPADAGVYHRDSDGRVVEQLMPRLAPKGGLLKTQLENGEVRPEKIHLLMMTYRERPARAQLNLQIPVANRVATPSP